MKVYSAFNSASKQKKLAFFLKWQLAEQVANLRSTLNIDVYITIKASDEK